MFIFVPNDSDDSLNDSFHISTDTRWATDTRWEDQSISELPPACPKRRGRETQLGLQPPRKPKRSETDLEVKLPKDLDHVLARLSIKLAGTLRKERELRSMSYAAIAA